MYRVRFRDNFNTDETAVSAAVLTKHMPTTVSATETLSETRTQTRDLLLQTALSMLEQGWFPSITELANASGVSRATAYRYFPSQAALVSTVVDESLGPVLQWQPTSTSVEARVNELLDFAYPRMEQHEGALRAALQVALQQWANERARRAEDEPKYRRGNRKRLLSLAVEPLLQAGVAPAAAARLAQSLSLLYGTEAMVVLKDFWGLDFQQFMDVVKWTSSALVRATLAEAGIAGAAGSDVGSAAGVEAASDAGAESRASSGVAGATGSDAGSTGSADAASDSIAAAQSSVGPAGGAHAAGAAGPAGSAGAAGDATAPGGADQAHDAGGPSVADGAHEAAAPGDDKRDS